MDLNMLFPIIFLVTVFNGVRSHLCIIHPRQRGPMNIQQAGDPTCFRHGDPCGSQPFGPAVATLTGGRSTFIKFQQNFNHHEIGYPGYMDIALSRSPNSTRFKILASIGDVNAHAQAHQQNYTIPLLTVDSKPLYGFSWDILKSPGTDLVSVNSVSGQITTASYQTFYFNMGVGVQYGTPSPKEESYKFLMDQIACHSREIPYIFLLEHRNGNITAKPNKILWIYLTAREIAGEYEIAQPASGHFVAISPYQRTNFLALLLNEQTPGSYNMTFATLDYMGNYQERLSIGIGKEFINFLWATPDLTKQLYYVIMGDENSPRQLKTVLWTYNITNNSISSMVNLDVSRYTISAIQVYEKTGRMFAVSPGLFGQESPAWSLVEVDPTTGSIAHVIDLVGPDLFEDYYGGTVFNLDQASGVMYHVFRVSGYTADVIATINLETKDVTFSQLTNLRHVYNLGNTYFAV